QGETVRCFRRPYRIESRQLDEAVLGRLRTDTGADQIGAAWRDRLSATYDESFRAVPALARRLRRHDDAGRHRDSAAGSLEVPRQPGVTQGWAWAQPLRCGSSSASAVTSDDHYVTVTTP